MVVVVVTRYVRSLCGVVKAGRMMGGRRETRDAHTVPTHNPNTCVHDNTHLAQLLVLVREHEEEAVEELGEPVQHVDPRHLKVAGIRGDGVRGTRGGGGRGCCQYMQNTHARTDLVQHGDPPDEELADVRVRPPNKLLRSFFWGGYVCMYMYVRVSVSQPDSTHPISQPTPQQTGQEASHTDRTDLEDGDEPLHVEDVRLGDDVLHQAVQQVGPVLHVGVPVREELAEALEDGVEVEEDVLPRDLGDVVEGLAGVVADAGLRVVEAVEDGREEEVEVLPDGGHEPDGRGGQRDEPALAVVRVGGRAELLLGCVFVWSCVCGGGWGWSGLEWGRVGCLWDALVDPSIYSA